MTEEEIFMIYIKVENLKSGQILARDVVDEKCRTLLKAGKKKALFGNIMSE